MFVKHIMNLLRSGEDGVDLLLPASLLCLKILLFSVKPQYESAISSVQLLSPVRLFATPWTAAHQASLSITNSRRLLKFMSIESVMLSNHLISVDPLPSYPQSFPALGSFPVRQLFASGGQNIGASASVLPMNMDSFRIDWFDLFAVQGTLKSLL